MCDDLTRFGNGGRISPVMEKWMEGWLEGFKKGLEEGRQESLHRTVAVLKRKMNIQTDRETLEFLEASAEDQNLFFHLFGSGPA